MHLDNDALHVAQVGTEAALPTTSSMPTLLLIAHPRHDLLQRVALHLPKLGRAAVARVAVRLAPLLDQQARNVQRLELVLALTKPGEPRVVLLRVRRR